jgi:hypothetical protein
VKEVVYDLTICASYSCEMALNIDIDASEMYDWKGI